MRPGAGWAVEVRVLSISFPLPAPRSLSCLNLCSLFSFSSHEIDKWKPKRLRKITNALEELERHVQLYPSVSEFFNFRTELARLREQEKLVSLFVPDFSRPSSEHSGTGSGFGTISMKYESPDTYGTARVFFVGGKIVGMSAEWDDFREDLVGAVPLDSIP